MSLAKFPSFCRALHFLLQVKWMQFGIIVVIFFWSFCFGFFSSAKTAFWRYAGTGLASRQLGYTFSCSKILTMRQESFDYTENFCSFRYAVAAIFCFLIGYSSWVPQFDLSAVQRLVSQTKPFLSKSVNYSRLRIFTSSYLQLLPFLRSLVPSLRIWLHCSKRHGV